MTNLFEGLPHRGISVEQRHRLTDFGSGYQGIKAEKADPGEEKKLKKRFDVFARALEEYGVEVGTGHKRIPIPKKALSEKDLAKIGFVSTAIAIPESGQETAVSFRHPDALYHLHSHRDTWLMHKDEHAATTMLIEKWRQKGGEGIVTPVKHFFAGLPHVFTEGVPGAYYWLKGKVTGVPPMLERVWEDIDPEYRKTLARVKGAGRTLWEEVGESAQAIRKTGGGIFRRIWNFFSPPEENRGVTSFDGMSHGGSAEARRKHITPFGSKYDRLKGIAQMLGMGEKEFLKSATFKKAISSAQEVRTLGAGSFGEAKLFRTAIPTPQGPEMFQFVQKETKGTLFGIVKEQAKTFKQYAGEHRWSEAVKIAFKPKEEFFAPYSAGFRLTREAGITQKLAHTEAVPSVYAASRGKMLMEYMPGQTLASFAEAGSVLPKKAGDILKDVAEEAATKGIANLDINAKNILYDPVSKRVSWIDWGMATETTAKREILTQKMISRISKRLTSVEAPGIKGLMGSVTAPLVPSVPLPAPAKIVSAPKVESAATLIYRRPKDSLARSAEALKLDQERIWSAATTGAKRHTNISNSVSVATVKPGR
jgi:predicted Ser/Thr protein kinase